MTYEGSLWDRAIAGEAQGVLEGALAQGPPGPYQLQAAIAACHSSAPDSARTDWAAVEHLYRQLGEMTRSPVVGLNWPVALAMVKGPQVGLEVTERLVADGALVGYHLLAATRADFLRRLGRWAEAAAAYREALALWAPNPRGGSSRAGWQRSPKVERARRPYCRDESAGVGPGRGQVAGRTTK